MSRTFRVIAFAVGVLAITSGRAQASYILTVPFLGDGPEAASDFGAHPQLNGTGGADSQLSLYPSSLPSYASPYVTNLLGTISDSSFADRFNPADIAIALHTSVLVHQGGNGNVAITAASDGPNLTSLADRSQGDQGSSDGQGENGNGPASTSAGSTWSPRHDEDGDYQGEDEDDDEDEDDGGGLAGAAVMPEPGSMILLGTGLLGLGAIVRRTRTGKKH